jgi:hypothetical protein
MLRMRAINTGLNEAHSTFQSLYSIGTNPRRYGFEIHKGTEERRQRYAGNSMAYRKWFRGKKATVIVLIEVTFTSYKSSKILYI